MSRKAAPSPVPSMAASLIRCWRLSESSTVIVSPSAMATTRPTTSAASAPQPNPTRTTPASINRCEAVYLFILLLKRLSMRFRVYSLRYHGRRRPWRDVIDGNSFEGDLLTYRRNAGNSVYLVATLIERNRPVDSALLPELFEPVLVGMAPQAMRLRGFEVTENGSDSGTALRSPVRTGA